MQNCKKMSECLWEGGKLRKESNWSSFPNTVQQIVSACKEYANKRRLSYCENFSSQLHLRLRLWSYIVTFWQKSKPIQTNYLLCKHKLPKPIFNSKAYIINLTTGRKTLCFAKAQLSEDIKCIKLFPAFFFISKFKSFNSNAGKSSFVIIANKKVLQTVYNCWGCRDCAIKNC